MCRDRNLLGETMRGGYAEYISLPTRQLYNLPADFDLRSAADPNLKLTIVLYLPSIFRSSARL